MDIQCTRFDQILTIRMDISISRFKSLYEYSISVRYRHVVLTFPNQMQIYPVRSISNRLDIRLYVWKFLYLTFRKVQIRTVSIQTFRKACSIRYRLFGQTCPIYLSDKVYTKSLFLIEIVYTKSLDIDLPKCLYEQTLYLLKLYIRNISYRRFYYRIDFSIRYRHNLQTCQLRYRLVVQTFRKAYRLLVQDFSSGLYGQIQAFR